MEALVVLGVLVTFLIIFSFVYEKDQKDRERVDAILHTFDSTMQSVLQTVEKTNTLFTEMVAKVEIEHFKQLQKQSDKQSAVFERVTDTYFTRRGEEKREKLEKGEKVSGLDLGEENSIEKGEKLEAPLSDDFSYIPFREGVNVQWEGEEEVYPVTIS